METVTFGTLNNTLSYSIYTSPSVLSKEMMERIYFIDNITNYQSLFGEPFDSSYEDSVTHGVFFGENIKRAIKILRTK